MKKRKFVKKRQASKTTRSKRFRSTKKRGVKKFSNLAVASSTNVGAGNSSSCHFPRLSKITFTPEWWRTLKRANTPQDFTGSWAGRVTANAGTKEPFCLHLHKSVYDIDGMLRYYSTDAKTDPESNAYKWYMFDYVRQHKFRNNSNVTTELELYVLYPRRDIPQYTVDASISAVNLPRWVQNMLAPSNPICAGTSLTGYYQSFADRPESGSLGKMQGNDPGVTPYQCPALCRLFKIKKLVVRWPNGQKSHAGVLESGQELNLTSASRKVKMYNYNNLGMVGFQSYTLYNTWQLLREMPVIFGYIRGTVSWDSASHGTVNYGIAGIDYICNVHYSAIFAESLLSATAVINTGLPSLTTAVTYVPVLGASATETLN